MANRRKFTSDFKKKVVLEALQERDTLAALAQKHEVHPQQITTWKAHFLANAAQVFDKEDARTAKDESMEKERDELLRTIGEQKVQIDFLKKNLR
ncbi:MAG TPA: transposase [Saprospiraceae bacterium]|nr:transposase [Saprospiraceae bacterium]